MNEKLPYYLAYPLSPLYDEDRAERLDLEYLKSMYPELPRKILPYIEEECDRMEYDNSMIYDQYPDKLQLKLMCARVCGRIEKYEKDAVEQPFLRDLTEVMLYQEIYKRRCSRRRTYRRFY